MAEYIEREKVYDIFAAKQQKLLKYHRYYQLNDADKEEFDLYDSYMNEVESIPSADVVEVVHGEWIEKRWYKRGDCYYTKNCSLCDCAVKPKYTYNFCPNCGAEMDGDN